MAIAVQDTFDPTRYSLEECQFLLDNLGKPPVVSLRQIQPERLADPARNPTTGKVIDKNPVHYPKGVIPAAVKGALDRIYELLALERDAAEPWVGLEAVKACITTYIEQATKWARDAKRGAPRFPSMHSFDTRNRPHRGGPGSDSGTVSTYFDANGDRHKFAINLFSLGHAGTWSPEWADKRAGTEQMETQAKGGLTLNADALRYECFCGHTEHFKAESRMSQNAARARMGKHLVKAPDAPEKHREIYTVEFGS